MQYDERKTGIPAKKGGSAWNILTVLVLLGMVWMVAFFILIYAYPNGFFNPFPPIPLPAEIVLPTATPIPTTLKEFPPTWTTTVTPVPTDTSTPRPVTSTPTPYSIPHTPGTQTPATPTLTISATIKANMPYEMAGTPVAVASTFFRPDSDCIWAGVGGQVLDLRNAPITGIYIQLGGVLGNKYLDLLSLTGTALQYGPAGYEFSLADKPVASKKTLWLQLLDQAGLPLSAKVYFGTSEDCSKNLILIKFKQVR
jgi:hypothetical protein